MHILVAAALVAAGPVLADTFKDAVAAYERKDYAQALRGFRQLAIGGDAAAQFALGLMYANGLDVPKDDQQAYFWWLLASVRGDLDAIKRRDAIEARVTSEQRAAAQAEARNWKPR